MKNKRTKFTAILLSALMAVSTISSVTWAADLFTDGSDGNEVIVEEPVDIVSEVEDEVEADNSVITGVASTDISNITFKDSGDKIQAVVTLTTKDNITGKNIVYGTFDAVKTSNEIAETCMYARRAVYSVSIQLEDKGITAFTSGKSNPAGISVVVPNELFCYSNTEVVPPAEQALGYIRVPGSKPLGDYDAGRGGYWHVYKEDYHVLGEAATCEKSGFDYVFPACSICGAIYKNGVYDDHRTTNAELKNYFDKKEFGVKTEPIARNDHDYQGAKVQILSADNFMYSVDGGITSYGKNSSFPTGKSFADYVANGVAVGLSATSLFNGTDSNDTLTSTYWLENKTSQNESETALLEYAPINNIDGKIVDPENGRDSYYYTYVICNDCGKAVHIVDKVYAKDTSGNVVGDYYEEVHGGNVVGFLAKTDKGTYPLYTNLYVDKFGDTNFSYGPYQNGLAYYIPFSEEHKIKVGDSRLADPLVPILEDCKKNGYYYIKKYVSDTPEAVSSETKEVSWRDQYHTWGTIEVAPSKTDTARGVTQVLIDGKASETEDSKLLTLGDEQRPTNGLRFQKDVSNGIIVTRDSNNNVIEAKSKDCISKGKYVLYRQCLICGVIQKVEVKTSDYNTDRHEFGPWSDPDTDDADNKYYIKDDETHIKYTYYHRQCVKCGFRQTKPAGEYEEPHQLSEKRVEDGPKEDPTCGKAGYYTVQLQCECGYKDKESIKKATIPPTDEHDFTGNDVELIPHGTVQIGKDGGFISKESPYNVYVEVVRKCNVCEEYDSNGINGITKGQVGCDPDLIIDTKVEGRTVEITREAKKDPNGIPYSCSEGEATITFNWAGKVDGKGPVKLEPLTVVVPYYPTLGAYTSRTDHKPVTRTETVKEATTTQEGSAIEITECSVCGEELSRKDIPIAKLGSAPSVKATAVNYNTVTVTWDAVEGAESYKVFNKSNALGISKWQLVATVNGTSYTDTGLVTGAKYRYTVKPVVDGVGGEYSKKGVIVCPKLTAPEIKSVTAVSTNKNKITWTKVDGASGYIVQRKVADGSWTRIATVRGGSNINCRDKKAVAGASYRVRAFRTVEKPNFVKSNVYGPFSVAK